MSGKGQSFVDKATVNRTRPAGNLWLTFALIYETSKTKKYGLLETFYSIVNPQQFKGPTPLILDQCTNLITQKLLP